MDWLMLVRSQGRVMKTSAVMPASASMARTLYNARGHKLLVPLLKKAQLGTLCICDRDGYKNSKNPCPLGNGLGGYGFLAY